MTRAQPAPQPAGAPRSPDPQSEPHTPLPTLTPQDRERLDLFSHVDADLVSLATNLCIQPTEALEWSLQPHIQPWLRQLTLVRREHRTTSLTKSLNVALDNVRRIIDSQAHDKLKVTAVNSLTKLANALLRAARPPSPDHPAKLVPLLQTANLDLRILNDDHRRRAPYRTIPQQLAEAEDLPKQLPAPTSHAPHPPPPPYPAAVCPPHPTASPSSRPSPPSTPPPIPPSPKPRAFVPGSPSPPASST